MDSFKFALFADAHYADRPMRIGRYYRNALKKIALIIDEMNAADVDFCIDMGDLIDWPHEPEKGKEALNTILPLLDRFKGSVCHVLGNHDADSIPKEELTIRYRFPSADTWYSFDHKGVHFIVLDANFNGEGRTFCPNENLPWDLSYIPEAELSWLREDLNNSAAELNVLLLHELLDDFENPHRIRNAAEVREILEKSRKKLLVFQGHMHSGHEYEKNGIGYHTLPSIVNGRSKALYWIVQVNPEEVTLEILDRKKKIQTKKLI